MKSLISFNDLHEVVDSLTAALDAKSHYTCGHSERVAEFSLLLAQGMGLSLQEQQRIHIGAHLHDIGKIGIPDAILNKNGKLTAEEFLLMRQHPEIGNKIINKIRIFRGIADIIHFHHERFGGGGYPDGLHGTDIPLGARIVAVADSLDAMISFRPYRAVFSFREAMQEIQRCRGTQFDPDVVDVFWDIYNKGVFSVYDSIQVS